MGQPIAIAKPDTNLNSNRKVKGNRSGALSLSLRRYHPCMTLLRGMTKRGHKSEKLYLEYYCLFKIASNLGKDMDIEQTLSVVKKIIRQHFPVDQYSLMLIDENSRDLVIRSQHGFARKHMLQTREAAGKDIFGAALKRRRGIYIPDIRLVASQHQHHLGNRGAFLALPLIPDNGQAIGLMNLLRQKPNSFSVKEIELLRKIASQTAQVIEAITAFQHNRELSITDELTGIYNRRYFNQRFEREIQRAQRYHRALSLIMLDIDRFKIFNDTHGHLIGDMLLKRVAQILDENLRKADILARFGGEEFVIVLPEIDKEHGRMVAEKLRLAIERSEFEKAETQPLGRLTISLGLASFPEDAQDAGELLYYADQGLYLAKSRGRNQVGVYSKNNQNIA